DRCLPAHPANRRGGPAARRASQLTSMPQAPSFLLRCLILAIALGPALPIGTVMASIGRRTLSPGLLGTAFAGGIIAAMLCLIGGVIFAMLPFPPTGLL